METTDDGMTQDPPEFKLTDRLIAAGLLLLSFGLVYVNLDVVLGGRLSGLFSRAEPPQVPE